MKKVIVAISISLFCFVGIHPEQNPEIHSEIQEPKIESQTLLARKLLLRFAQSSVDFINEQKTVCNSLAAIHDSTITSANKFSVKKQLTKNEWNTACHVKELEKEHDKFLKQLAISSDFLVIDAIDEQELHKQVYISAEQVTLFCRNISLKSFTCSEQDSTATMLSKIESSISKIEARVQKIQNDPTALGRIKKTLWGSNFSYLTLPILITTSLFVTNLMVTKKQAKKAEQNLDTLAAEAVATVASTERIRIAAKWGVSVSKNELSVYIGQAFTEMYKSLQYNSYQKQEYKRNQSLRLQEQRIKKIFGENTKFDDIVGYDDIKKEVHAIVESLVNPLKFKRFGVDVPKGVLFAGAPGTGKTLFARAISGESGCPCFVINPGDLIEDKKHGNSSSKIDDLFAQAEACAPSIIFIDEIDFIGSRKNKEIEKSTALANLLTKLNGFKARNPYRPVLIIAATNCPEDLDEALIRSGRFDIKIKFKLPDAFQRGELIRKELMSRATGNVIDFEEEQQIIKLTEYCSAADIINIMNKSFLKTRFQGGEIPTLDTFTKAIQEVKGVTL